MPLLAEDKAVISYAHWSLLVSEEMVPGYRLGGPNEVWGSSICV